MQISHRYQFIFFSNPKTGSETVRKILEPYSDEKILVYQQTTKRTSILFSYNSSRDKKDFSR